MLIVAAYMANLLLGIVLMYHPEESATAVWTQLLTVYSLLISGLIAIGAASLSRFHSEMTIFLVMSPLVRARRLQYTESEPSRSRPPSWCTPFLASVGGRIG